MTQKNNILKNTKNCRKEVRLIADKGRGGGK